jgi:hypothetical protein
VQMQKEEMAIKYVLGLTKTVRKGEPLSRAQPGSNRWPIDLQSIALPLSYGPICVNEFKISCIALKVNI